ncbi:unnamed protein product [Thlaspi arvense]|uniref:KIB1-4 beta-propeller domain-containing protein n=1 Tax=Thlaspi arvense TaxID=13288 RepID=A0AAU9T149_THLAR|nr:unnamed protein product [Thlaspi arvense]
MSQLVSSRLSWPSVCKNFIRRTHVRLFSSTTDTSGSDSDDEGHEATVKWPSSTPAYPFLMVDHILNNPDRILTSFRSKMQFSTLDKKVEDQVCDAMTVGVPKSKAWPCSRTDHLVESPTGQQFLVKWYCDDLEEFDRDSDVDDDVSLTSRLEHETAKFVVFREGHQSYSLKKTMIYTEDIGDLCIFLGHSEAFCAPASSSPGLKPNCIYFVGLNFGVYDLTTKTSTIFCKETENPLRRLKFPYWPSPSPL